MLIKKKDAFSRPYSEVTPKVAMADRRAFMTRAMFAGAAAFMGEGLVQPAFGESKLQFQKSPFSDQQPPTALKYISGYNNYYEFGSEKDDPAKNSGALKTRPWAIAIEGEVKKPETLDLDVL